MCKYLEIKFRLGIERKQILHVKALIQLYTLIKNNIYSLLLEVVTEIHNFLIF